MDDILGCCHKAMLSTVAEVSMSLHSDAMASFTLY